MFLIWLLRLLLFLELLLIAFHVCPQINVQLHIVIPTLENKEPEDLENHFPVVTKCIKTHFSSDYLTGAPAELFKLVAVCPLAFATGPQCAPLPLRQGPSVPPCRCDRAPVCPLAIATGPRCAPLPF